MSEKKNKQQQDKTPDHEVIEGELVETAADSSTDETGKSSAPQQAKAEPEAEVAASAEAPSEAAPSAAAPEQPEPPAQPQDAGNKDNNSNSWTGKAALVLSLVALGASGYLYSLTLQQSQVNEALRGTLAQEVKSSITSSNNETSRSLADLSRRLDDIRTQAAADKVGIEELQLRLTRSMQQVNAQQQRNRTDWLLAEVEYLLRLANQRVLMEKTADGALPLLKSADKILQETDDVSIYEVRKALATDIAALEAVPTLDTEGVFLKLGAMNDQIESLRLIPLAEKRELPELLKEITPDAVSESWTTSLKENWNKALDKLSSLIVIQHRDEKIEPLLAPEETFYLKQNLHLMLEQAQMALLQREQAAFSASLTKAQRWATEYFDKKDATTQALVRGLEDLKTVQVAPQVPDISGSLRALKGYLQAMAKLKEEGAK